MNSSYTAFKKQADRSFFPGSTMAAPYTERSAAAPTEGGVPATPEQIRSQEAWNEGFKEGLTGAIRGDGFRGVARGFMRTAPALIDSALDAPIRAKYIPSMLGAKGVTAITGNDKLEQFVRKLRALDMKRNILPHKATSGIRQFAESKALDPKYLSPAAYQGAVDAGTGAAYATDFALYRGIPMGILAGMQTADELSKIPGEINKAKAEARAKQAILDRMLNRVIMRTAGPRVATTSGPTLLQQMEQESKTPILDASMKKLIEQDPEYKELISQQKKREYKDLLEQYRQIARLKQTAKQTGVAGLGGLAGLAVAHQITKRIPALKKRKALRYLLNMAAAGGLGYAGWKLAGK